MRRTRHRCCILQGGVVWERAEVDKSEVDGSNPSPAVLQYGGGLTRVISGWASDICTRKVEGGEKNGRDQCAVG